jgi:4-amino-4-deoxy-L-arabinose transferase-like glycosyltransferase
MPTLDNSPRPPLSSHSMRWLLIALALFMLQVLPFLSYRWVTDESWYAGPAYSIAQGHGVADPAIGPNDLENRMDTRPPGTALVMAASFRSFGAGQIQARLGSVLAGLLVVLLVWRLTQPLIGPEGAAVAALVTATDNLLVATSRTARPEALTIMAVMLSLLAMSMYARTAGRSRSVWAFVSGILIAMAAMFHITVGGFIVSFALLAIVIDRKRGEFGLRGVVLYVAGFCVGLVPFATWVLTAPLGKESFREEYLSRAGGDLHVRIVHEMHRYSDVFGLNMLHGHGLDSLPVRLPIPLCFLFATWLLWRYARQWFYLEMLLLLPTLLWFVETVNKSSRYMALIAPMLGFAFGAAIMATRGKGRWRTAILVASGFVIVAQLGANLLLLRGASKADYNRVGALLDAAVPVGEPAYGTITFWLAMRNHPYISQERTTPEMAAHDYGVHYFILGDRMMAEGNDWDAEFYEKTRKSLADIQANGTLVRSIPDPYYGNLRVYRTQ